METPQRKRGGILGFAEGLFRSSRAIPETPKAAGTAYTSPSNAQPETSLFPADSVQHTSGATMASRKIHDLPQGRAVSSSKMTEFSSFASDSTKATNFSAMAITPRRMPGDNPNASSPRRFAGNKSVSFSGIPGDNQVSTSLKRMPGDNPNKFRTNASSSFTHTPTDSYNRTSHSGAATAPRSLFRRSVMNQKPAIPFSPGASLRKKLAPPTFNRAPRAQKSGASAMESSTDHVYDFTIPSPPEHLTGDFLTKQAPSDHPRSVYADEYLAEYCPPDYDQERRSQFFCILDLRRLKYAADEVFVKKKWDLNIINWAKEYQKHRSLILLRYGLYELKSVKPSAAIEREWKKKHGIPDSDDEEGIQTSKANMGSKRKAEEQLTPKNSESTIALDGAKRARLPSDTNLSPQKAKRKADEMSEPDNSQPSKLYKAAPSKTASATKNLFESIASKSQPSSTNPSTPVQPPAKDGDLFSPATNRQPVNVISGQSVLDTGSPNGDTVKNMFGHLQSSGNGKDNHEEDSVGTTGFEEDKKDDAGKMADGQAEKPTSGPSGASTADESMNGGSCRASSTTGSTQGRSLFERITGPTGKPLIELAPSEENPKQAEPSAKPTGSPVINSTADRANMTWNTNTPIKFSTTAASSLAGPGAAGSIFGSAPAKAVTSVPPPPISASSDNGEAASMPEGPSSSKNLKPDSRSSAEVSAFGQNNDTAKAGTNLKMVFASGPAAFSQPDGNGETRSSAVPAAISGAATSTDTNSPAAGAGTPSQPSVHDRSLFGSQSKTLVTSSDTQPSSIFGIQPAGSSSAPSSGSMFGPSPPAATGAIFGKPAGGASGTQNPTTTPFGTQQLTSSNPGLVTKSAQVSSNIFGNSGPAAGAAASIFANKDGDSRPGNTNFGASQAEDKSFSANEAKNPFSTVSSPSFMQESRPIFGSMGSPANKAANIFANANPSHNPTPSGPSFSFGNSQAPMGSQPKGPSIFGNAVREIGASSFAFGASGSTAGNSYKNPFSSAANPTAPPSFNFGAEAKISGGQSSPASFNFGGGDSSKPSISFTSVSGSAGQQSSMFSFNTNQPSSQSFNLGSNVTAPGGTSTGTSNSLFAFGRASTMATTPAAGTPEPAAEANGQGTEADGDDAPQEQISLTGAGAPGEEDEAIQHEVRAKALKLMTGDGKKNNSPWATQGVGPFRLLKNKTTGTVRMLLRAEPRGNVALNRSLLPDFIYKADNNKYIKITTSTDDGKGLETWMIQVKTAAAATALAEAMEANKSANAKDS